MPESTPRKKQKIRRRPKEWLANRRATLRSCEEWQTAHGSELRAFFERLVRDMVESAGETMEEHQARVAALPSHTPCYLCGRPVRSRCGVAYKEPEIIYPTVLDLHTICRRCAFRVHGTPHWY